MAQEPPFPCYVDREATQRGNYKSAGAGKNCQTGDEPRSPVFIHNARGTIHVTWCSPLKQQYSGILSRLLLIFMVLTLP
jgi:hypothetical protein